MTIRLSSHIHIVIVWCSPLQYFFTTIVMGSSYFCCSLVGGSPECPCSRTINFGGKSGQKLNCLTFPGVKLREILFSSLSASPPVFCCAPLRQLSCVVVRAAMEVWGCLIHTSSMTQAHCSILQLCVFRLAALYKHKTSPNAPESHGMSSQFPVQ